MLSLFLWLATRVAEENVSSENKVGDSEKMIDAEVNKGDEEGAAKEAEQKEEEDKVSADFRRILL